MKKIIIVLLTILFVGTATVGTYALSVKKEENYQSQINTLEEELDTLNSELEETTVKLEEANKKLNAKTKLVVEEDAQGLADSKTVRVTKTTPTPTVTTTTTSTGVSSNTSDSDEEEKVVETYSTVGINTIYLADMSSNPEKHMYNLNNDDCIASRSDLLNLLIQDNNTVYSRKLAQFMLQNAFNIYEDTVAILPGMSKELNYSDYKAFYNVLGFDSQFFNAESLLDGEKINSIQIDASDINSYIVAHTNETISDVNYDVYIVTVQGSTDDYYIWESNTDIGANCKGYADLSLATYRNVNDSTYTTLSGDLTCDMEYMHPDWKNYDNHKGFDVTANRIIEKVDAYIEATATNNSKRIILITGHSRGGAIANLVGAYYDKKENIKAYTYTFAAPNTTQDTNRATYSTIFNLHNSEDAVTYFAMEGEGWNFGLYGTTITKGVTADYNNELKTLLTNAGVSINIYSCAKVIGIDVKEAFNSAALTREAAYEYEGSENNTATKNLITSSKAAALYTNLSSYYCNGVDGSGRTLADYVSYNNDNKIYIKPALVLEVLAGAIGAGDDMIDYVNNYNVFQAGSPCYNVFNSMAYATIAGNLFGSHSCQVYQVMAMNITNTAD